MANAIAAAPSVGVVTGPDCGTKYDCNGSGGTAYAAGAIKTASTAIALPNAASFTITPPPSWGTQNRVSHRRVRWARLPPEVRRVLSSAGESGAYSQG